MATPPRLNRWFAGVLLGLAIVVLDSCACARRDCDEVPPPSLGWQELRSPVDDAMIICDEALGVCVRERLHSGGPLRVLALSGGAQNGAFGAGFLAGWADFPTPGEGPPKHDIVTGVSTGALMATFAFLGEPTDLEALRRFYTEIERDDVFHRRSLLPTPCSDAFYSERPLEKLIADAITEKEIERVAVEHARGRRLLVATVELDSGALWIWNLSGLAHEQRRGGLARFRKILLASAMVPVMFPPIEIDRRLHADAGLREMVLMREFVASVGARIHGADPQGAESVQVDVIVNGKIGVARECVQPNLPSLAERSLRILLDEMQSASLRRIHADSLLQGWRFRFVRIPTSFPVGDESYEFDREAMRQLYELGRSLGRSGQAWEVELPPAFELPQARRN